MVCAGIERCAETGERFQYLNVPSMIVEVRGARCEQCNDLAVCDVLRRQTEGRRRFAFPAEIIGDEQWCSLCEGCSTSWYGVHGFPVFVHTTAESVDEPEPGAEPEPAAAQEPEAEPLAMRRSQIQAAAEAIRGRYHAASTQRFQ